MNGLKGYIQEIVHDPFGFLLISDMQVIKIFQAMKMTIFFQFF